jgi:glycogen debranching enzyme
MRTLCLLFISCIAALLPCQIPGQTPVATTQPLAVLPAFPVRSDLPSITRETEAIKPFSVLGPRGALLGQQNGEFEAWIFPWKIFDGMRITANMQDYPIPIELNPHAAEIDVQPDHTTITYSHANFTVKQIMFAPKNGPSDAGALVLFQIEAVRPMDLTFSFHPRMQRMWPALSDDVPSPEWVDDGHGSGFYILHLNFPDHAAALAMPGATSGILPPYQERPAEWPLQFVLHFDPKSDQGKLFPLLMTVGNAASETTKPAFAARLQGLDASVQQVYQKNQTYYRDFLAAHTSLDSPDTSLNADFGWAETAIDQLLVKTTPCQKEEALTAGFVGSGDAARPGFGWFFGRDSLWSLYAVNSYGGFATTKKELDFLLARQSPEGKIMHEWSQTADLVDWKALPYEYASADATPLLQMATDDYLKISGDRLYVQSIWPQLAKAWQFETTHDTDGDGIYDNSEGTGWVESWVPTMPHQEIYLAALDEQASVAFADLARATGHSEMAQQAEARGKRVAATLLKEYALPAQQDYAFSYNGSAGVDATPTIFPAVAWWDGDFSLPQSDAMMSHWADSHFSTDWGTRDLSDQVSFYDPISYHQGSVWPLFTGWVSVAEYRTGQALSGYQHLMQNANLTYAQDLGDATELLSGQFYQVLGRSTAHQLWSSAMVISPVLRGMFGLEWNVAQHTLIVTPHLPAAWPGATLRHVPFGNSWLDLVCTRESGTLRVAASGPAAAGLKLASHDGGVHADGDTLRIPLPAVEAGVTEALPEFGSETHQLKVLDERYGARSLTLQLSAPGGSTEELTVRENHPGLQVKADGAQLGVAAGGLSPMTVHFAAAGGYTTQTITLSW